MRHGGTVRLTAEKLRKLIVEEVEASLDSHTRLSTESVDNQIDSLLIKFESESLKQEARSFSLSSLMLEQGEEEEEPTEMLPPDEDDTGSTVDSSEREEEWGVEGGKPPLDVDQYTQRVVRLVEHYDSLLDIKTVILNRAKNYVLENYDEAAVSKYEETLEVDHGLSLDPRDNEPEEKIAVGAGPIGGTI